MSVSKKSSRFGLNHLPHSGIISSENADRRIARGNLTDDVVEQDERIEGNSVLTGSGRGEIGELSCQAFIKRKPVLVMKKLLCFCLGFTLVFPAPAQIGPSTAPGRSDTAPPRTDIVWSNSVWYWKPYSLAWSCLTNALACTNGARGNFADMFTDFWRPDQRNTNFWMRRFTGWPAYSVWNDYCTTNRWPTNGNHSCGGNTTYIGAGVLVSPEHFLTTGHEGFPTNTWLAFLDMSNNVVFRQVQDYFYQNRDAGNEPPNNLTTNMPSSSMVDLGYDYYIGLLNEPVPDNIGYMRVIPTNWWAYFDASFLDSATNYPHHVPLLVYNNQNRQPGMQDLVTLGCYSGYRNKEFAYLTLTNHTFSFGGGDSGSPDFFVLDGELCLAGLLSSTLHFGDLMDRPDPAYAQARVNATMAELSLRNGRTNLYTLTVKDLSKFPVYHPSYQCPP
jgi:hypothetical protein